MLIILTKVNSRNNAKSKSGKLKTVKNVLQNINCSKIDMRLLLVKYLVLYIFTINLIIKFFFKFLNPDCLQDFFNI